MDLSSCLELRWKENIKRKNKLPYPFKNSFNIYTQDNTYADTDIFEQTNSISKLTCCCFDIMMFSHVHSADMYSDKYWDLQIKQPGADDKNKYSI